MSADLATLQALAVILAMSCSFCLIFAVMEALTGFGRATPDDDFEPTHRTIPCSVEATP